MTHIEFFPYHNFHIRFRLISGKELSGVVTDTVRQYNPELSDTVYAFIPTANMIEWKRAEQAGDIQKMQGLTSEIDIKNIVWAERIKY